MPYTFANKIEYRLVHVIFIHSSGDCCLYKLTDELPSFNSRIHSRFCLDFHAMRRQKKELCKRLIPPYHSSCSLKI